MKLARINAKSFTNYFNAPMTKLFGDKVPFLPFI